MYRAPLGRFGSSGAAQDRLGTHHAAEQQEQGLDAAHPLHSLEPGIFSVDELDQGGFRLAGRHLEIQPQQVMLPQTAGPYQLDR